MGKFIDLTGKRFGRLVVLERVEDQVYPRGGRQRRWLCRCDCGNTKLVTGSNLTNRNVMSCGCLHKEVARELGKKGEPRPLIYEIKGDVAELNIGGEKILCDAEDIDKLSRKGWHIGRSGYVCSTTTAELMHRMIMDAKKGELIDHINRDIHDNRKCNLRRATWSINAYNRDYKIGRSGYKYIHHYKIKSGDYYRVMIGNKIIYNTKYLDEAIKARNQYFETSEAKASGATLQGT